MGVKQNRVREMRNVGHGVLAGCGNFEYGGKAEISPSMIHNKIINPSNKKDCLTSLNSSMNLSLRFSIILPFILLNP